MTSAAIDPAYHMLLPLMDFTTFAVTLGLSTGEEQLYICFEDRCSSSSIYNRPRNWADRCRLLFQSLCSDANWAEEAVQNFRAAGDDEDLVAILHESMP